jgi:hypothetical protein
VSPAAPIAAVCLGCDKATESLIHLHHGCIALRRVESCLSIPSPRRSCTHRRTDTSQSRPFKWPACASSGARLIREQRHTSGFVLAPPWQRAVRYTRAQEDEYVSCFHCYLLHRVQHLRFADTVWWWVVRFVAPGRHDEAARSDRRVREYPLHVHGDGQENASVLHTV